MVKIIICIPAYNEELTIGVTLDEIHRVMKQTTYDYSINVQNDGSIDETKKIAELHGAKVFDNIYNMGLAKTFKNEIEHALEAGADIFILADGDNQYKSEHIPELIKKVEEGNDLVLGSRFLQGNRYSGSKDKSIGNKIFSHIISRLVRRNITDSTTGFRAFNRKVAALPIINTFTYTHEQIIRAVRKRLKVVEIPIGTNPTRKSKLFSNKLDYLAKSTVNILRLYRDFNPIKFFGSIGILWSGLGLGALFWGLLIKFIPNFPFKGTSFMIVGLLCFLAGLQMILFGFIADMNVKD